MFRIITILYSDSTKKQVLLNSLKKNRQVAKFCFPIAVLNCTARFQLLDVYVNI